MAEHATELKRHSLAIVVYNSQFDSMLDLLSSLLRGGSWLGGSVARCVLEDSILGYSSVKIVTFLSGYLLGALTLLLVFCLQGQRRERGSCRAGSDELETRSSGRGALPRRRVASEASSQEEYGREDDGSDRRKGPRPRSGIHLVGAHPHRGRVPRGADPR
eukprot:2002360-Amphidinium_carterae.1